MPLTWTPTQAGALDLTVPTVFPPAITVDVTGGEAVITATFVWGAGEDGPYYNASGVTAGEEAVLIFDGTTGQFSLRPVEV